MSRFRRVLIVLQSCCLTLRYEALALRRSKSISPQLLSGSGISVPNLEIHRSHVGEHGLSVAAPGIWHLKLKRCHNCVVPHGPSVGASAPATLRPQRSLPLTSFKNSSFSFGSCYGRAAHHRRLVPASMIEPKSLARVQSTQHEIAWHKPSSFEHMFEGWSVIHNYIHDPSGRIWIPGGEIWWGCRSAWYEGILSVPTNGWIRGLEVCRLVIYMVK
ncbi:hypothetical protein Dimus_009038 [Dionaea muscipula]